jgi:hypothetical protein
VEKKDTCASCGLPKQLGEDLFWTVDGNIYTGFKPRREMLFFDHRELGALFDRAVQRGGEELKVRLKETRRRYNRNRTLQQMEGASAGLISGRVYRKRAVLSVLDAAALFGWGRVTVKELEPPESLKLEVAHPYHPDLFAADMAGFWEGFFELRTEYELEQKEPTVWSLELKGIEEKKYHQPERKPIPENKAGKRDKSLERCRKCGAPAALSVLQWDSAKGTIFDPATSRYLVVMEVAGLQALMREMRNHLAGDYAEVVRTAFLEQLRGPGKPPSVAELYHLVLEPWPVLGWGKPSDVKLRPFLAEVVVTCPALPSFAEQKIAACWQLAEDEPAVSDGSGQDGRDLKVTVGPQLAEYSINTRTLMSRYPQLTRYPLSFLPW